jgi:hypothetical protein
MAFNYSPKVVTDGLVLYLDAANPKSYPGSGTAWRDISRSGNNGTLTNGPTFNNGNGGSIVFDGVNDYITVSTTPINTVLTNEITIETFINSNNLTNYIVIGGGQDNTLYRYTAAFNSGLFNNKFGFDLEATLGQVRLSTTSTYSTGVWIHLIGTYDGTTAKFYVNTILEDIDTGTSGNIVDFDSIILGRDIDFGIGRLFNGKMALYRIYNRALSAQEIQQNYNATKTRFGL